VLGRGFNVVPGIGNRGVDQSPQLPPTKLRIEAGLTDNVPNKQSPEVAEFATAEVGNSRRWIDR
jgi:hypothetical protein